MEIEGGGGGGGLQAPSAVEFMTEFSQNAQIFSGLLPTLSGAVGLILAHEKSIADLAKLLSNVGDPVQAYEKRLEELEKSADTVILVAEAIEAGGVDQPEWQASHRLSEE